MKLNHRTYIFLAVFAAGILFLLSGCEREFGPPVPATYPTTPDIFLDGFSGGLEYAAFGGSKVTAFEVDNEETFAGESSMRFEVPDAGDPRGGYAGGAFVVPGGRDLTGYDALTFYAKATQAATLDIIGFGNDLGEARYQASVSDFEVNTNWKKYIIPIPDPSRLTQEQGMLFFSEAPEEDKGYTFWLDEVKFEKLGTLAHPKGFILEGQDQMIPAETGRKLPIGGAYVTYNLPSGVDQRVNAAPSYFSFTSSNNAVATVDSSGVVSVIDAGTATVTATILDDIEAEGSLTVESTGEPVGPRMAAPVPTRSADSVIAMFSDAYTNVPIDTWNTRWEFSTAENFDIQVDGDNVIRYIDLNFVGIEFTSQTIDISGMSHFHIDVWTPDATAPPASFKVLLIDFGPDGTFDGGDDTEHELTFTAPTLATEEWFSIDVPLSNFTGLTGRSNLAQMVLSGDLPNIYIDNVYFYITASGGGGGGGGGGGTPTMAAPTPTQSPADVISVFSDTYTNIDGTNLNPDWGQATVVSQVDISGNNTLKYEGLNYQGVEFQSSQNVTSMTTLHLDVWTDNSTALNVFLISPGNPDPVEMAFALPVPTSGWASVDIPLTSFNPVDLADVIQMKFEGNGDIYLDNIYFHKGGGGGGGSTPSTAAPTPSFAAGDVISLFSDAYTNVDGTNLNPDWGQATMVSQTMIDGNNTLVYTGLNYQGMELGSSQDVSSFADFHLDVWTANSTQLEVFLISPGNPAVETAFTINVPTSGWSNVVVPLSDFAPVDLSDVFQIKFEGNGDIYLDNILFKK